MTFIRRCSKCGKPGHRVTTCGRERRIPDSDYNKPIDQEKIEEIVRLKSEENLSVAEISRTVGVSVATVLRTLSRNGVSHRVRSIRSSPPITVARFNDCRALKVLGATSSQIAKELDIDLREVNATWLAGTYEKYLEQR